MLLLAMLQERTTETQGTQTWQSEVLSLCRSLEFDSAVHLGPWRYIYIYIIKVVEKMSG